METGGQRHHKQIYFGYMCINEIRGRQYEGSMYKQRPLETEHYSRIQDENLSYGYVYSCILCQKMMRQKYNITNHHQLTNILDLTDLYLRDYLIIGSADCTGGVWPYPQ